METKQRVKIQFSGKIISVQPRSNVWRYRLDNRTHTLTGYNLFLIGVSDNNKGVFSVAISEKQQEKLHARIGDEISGTAWTKMYPQLEYADYYRAGSLKKSITMLLSHEDNPPWDGDVPELSVYDSRGCRMLDSRCWSNKCFTCKWACMANVTIEYDWGNIQKFRFESFCYGPKNCKLYKMGRPRAVPYKGCGSSYDDGCLDEMFTSQREDDE